MMNKSINDSQNSNIFLTADVPEFELATIDLIVVILYIVFILALGYYVGRREKTSESFFLAGRASAWPLVGFSLMSANLSGTSYLGLAGAGYHDGIAVWNYEWMATLVLVFFTLFILPFYLRSKIQTITEFLERRYDRRSRYVYSCFTVFTAMLIDSAGALFAGAVTLNLLFPEVPLWILIAALTFFAGIYVVLGGLRAVMITDTIQGFLLLTGGGIIFYLGFQELGSWQAITDAAPPNGFSLFKPADDDFLPWPGIFTGVLWLGIYYWITNHVVVQKVLSAKSLDQGRWGMLFAAFTQLLFLFLLILPGVMGRVIYPDLEEPDQVWPALAFDFLPVGFRGILFAALVAALMSTLDSVLNGASSLVVNDFLKRTGIERDEKKLLIYGRVMVIIFMIIAGLWAPVIFRFEGIVEYFQSFLGHITMPVVVIYLGGLFWKKATAAAAFYTLLIGVPLGFVAFIANEIFGFYELQFLYACGILLLISVIIFGGITLLSKAPQQTCTEKYTWSKQEWKKESEALYRKKWWENYRLWALVLTLVTFFLIIMFA